MVYDSYKPIMALDFVGVINSGREWKGDSISDQTPDNFKFKLDHPIAKC